MDVKDFLTDPKLEDEGVWVDVGDGFRVKVRRMFNPDFERFVRQRTRLLGPKGRDIETQAALATEAMIETVLLDWDGLTENGKPLKYSKATATRLMKDSRDFRNVISEIAQDAANFHAEAQEEDRKN